MGRPARPDDLTPLECKIMLGLVREGLRKTRRSRDRGSRRWGQNYESSTLDRRAETLEALYVKLGGDPKILAEAMHRDEAHG